MRRCSSCVYWKQDSRCPDPDVTFGVMVSLCVIDQHGHDRKEAKEWMRGSDTCSKWTKKVKSQEEINE